MPVEKSAGAVVFYKSGQKIEYLLIRNSSGKTWGFPKGIVEKDDELKATAIREVKEEAGLTDLEFVDGFKQTVRYFLKAKYPYQLAMGFKPGQTILKFATYFLARAKDKEVKLSFEHDDFVWLEFVKARELAAAGSKKVLEEAEKFLREKSSVGAKDARRGQDSALQSPE